MTLHPECTCAPNQQNGISPRSFARKNSGTTLRVVNRSISFNDGIGIGSCSTEVSNRHAHEYLTASLKQRMNRSGMKTSIDWLCLDLKCRCRPQRPRVRFCSVSSSAKVSFQTRPMPMLDVAPVGTDNSIYPSRNSYFLGSLFWCK